MMNKEYLDEIDLAIRSALETKKPLYTPKLYKAMEYSLFSSGKRVRPYLMYLSADFMKLDKATILPLAIALELIHNYSLIHDDLPCMDNDDFRRGKPSCHKVFGEAMALLAGDALLNLAYETLVNAVAENGELAQAAAYLAKCAGAEGMIGGQAIEFSFEEFDETTITELYMKKTGALICAAVISPGLMGCDKEKFHALGTYATAVGLSFQLCDDLLDEEKNEEKSYLNVMGKENTVAMVNRLTALVEKTMSKFGKDAAPLIQFSEFLVHRKK